MADLNKYIGWGISTLLLSLISKGSNSSDESSTPDDLNVSSNQTKIGNPVPVVLGRCLVKSPIVSYFGDFSSEIYTETYAAHASFSAWPLVLSLIAQYIAMAFTGHIEKAGGQQTGNAPVEGGSGGKVSTVKTDVQGTTKDDYIGPLLNMLFMWLLNWLINGRNLKTTVQKGFKYYLGYQFLVAWSGPKMRIRKIYMAEEEASTMDVSRETQNGAVLDVDIDKPDLFGGVDENGGFVGHFHVYLGGSSQGNDPWMVTQMSKDTVQAELRGMTPAYRPFVSIVVPTAYIGKQSTIPETWIELQNCPDHLGLGQVGEDANPAEVIYEIQTNTDWGLAESSDIIDKDSLVAMGQTLAAEGVGISVQITNITKARDLIDKICEHVNAVKFADPITGKLTFKLIRDDYNADDCIRLDVSNCSKVEFTRLDWSETISKISVTYTDAANQYEEGTVPATDSANIMINNGVKTVKSYDYTYFTTPQNAYWAAMRQLNTQAYPLAAVNIEGNRQLSRLRIGDVIILNWAPYGIKDCLIRVTNVDMGDFKEGKVTIDGIEDVFGLAKTAFGFSGSTEWQPEDKYPVGVQNFKYMEMPWEIVNDEDSYVAAFAAQPDSKTEAWTVWRQAQGGTFGTTTTLSKWTPTGRIVYDIDEFSDVEDTLGFEVVNLCGIDELTSSTVDIAIARKGSRLLVVDEEIMAYSTLTQLPNGHWYVKGIIRGACDTVPAKHGAQSVAFFIHSGNYANVTTGGPVISAGNTTSEQYNITTSTVNHTEDFDYTKVKDLTTKRRSEAPSVPGHIRMSAHLVHDVRHISSLSGDLSISFIERNNRQSFGAVSQDDETEYWTGQAFSAASGTDYVARVIVGSDIKDYVFSVSPASITWEQHCSDFADIISESRVELYARRNGLLSYQPQVRTFQWQVPYIVDGVTSEADGQARLAAWSIADRIVIPNGPIATTKQILYADLPIIVLGTIGFSTDLGAICCYDGSYIVPDGRIMRITGQGTYTVYTMQTGFACASYFVPTASGGSVRYYKWNGTNMVERT